MSTNFFTFLLSFFIQFFQRFPGVSHNFFQTLLISVFHPFYFCSSYAFSYFIFSIFIIILLSFCCYSFKFRKLLLFYNNFIPNIFYYSLRLIYSSRFIQIQLIPLVCLYIFPLYISFLLYLLIIFITSIKLMLFLLAYLYKYYVASTFIFYIYIYIFIFIFIFSYCYSYITDIYFYLFVSILLVYSSFLIIVLLLSIIMIYHLLF